VGESRAVDSGYFAVIGDVGLLGLAALLTVFGRLLVLGVRSGRQGSSAGWLAVALLTVMLIDAVTRASFTAFPTAFVGLLLVGVALAAAQDQPTSGLAGSTGREAN
jgi:hypothetical protein